MTDQESKSAGFTLIEVLVSLFIVTLGIAAVFGFIAVSDDMIENVKHSEDLDGVVTDIVETIHADKANIQEYAAKNLDSCGSLTTSSGKDKQLAYLRRWCRQLGAESGNTEVGDTRKINVIQTKVDGKDVHILTVELTNKDGKNLAFAKRVFESP
jgi:prepilin-type N-terminal cleavage/methylation domain-containing protein